MWPQPRLPPHPAMSEKTQQGKLAAAKKKLKAYWQRKSPGIPAGANRKKKINGSSPDTATSGGYHSPGDSATGIYGEGRASSTTLEDLESQYQELAVALDSSSAIISQLTENINSLVRTSKEEKKHEIHLVQKLGRSLFKLKNQTAEPLAPEPPAGPSKVEQLQDETNHLRKELESVGRQLQAEVENNQMLSLLNRRQEERLREQEERLREQEERLREQEERLCEQEERLREQEERLREQEERLCEQEERLREHEERLCEQEERLCEQEERLREQEERLHEQEERLCEQEERLREQEERLCEQEERLREQEERLCEQEERLREQEERLCEQEKLPGQERLLEEVEKLLEQERRQEEQERLLERERLLEEVEKLLEQERRQEEQERLLEREELLDEVEELLEQERLRQQDERLWQQETLQELERLRELERMLELGWEALYEQRAEPRSGFEELVRCPTWGGCPLP
nr:PUTATIVE PSEUDOGENE: RecName: Full=Putative golgin subfamily A member 6-like protein 3 [Homo sapiens]